MYLRLEVYVNSFFINTYVRYFVFCNLMSRKRVMRLHGFLCEKSRYIIRFPVQNVGMFKFAVVFCFLSFMSLVVKYGTKIETHLITYRR